MKLTTKGRYAVAALTDIAVFSDAPMSDGASAGAPVGGPDIALRQGISQPYLDQLMGKLRRAGLVESVRGAEGGYRLSRPAREIRIADIVAAVDEEIRTTACAGAATGCTSTGARCMTHDLWDEFGRHIELFLNAVTLEDVVAKRVLGTAAVNPPTAHRTESRPDMTLGSNVELESAS